MGHLQVVAVGDASKAREILTKYGKVEVYDAEGKLVVPPSQNEKQLIRTQMTRMMRILIRVIRVLLFSAYEIDVFMIVNQSRKRFVDRCEGVTVFEGMMR